MNYFLKKKNGDMVKYTSETIYVLKWTNTEEEWSGNAYSTIEDAIEAAEAAMVRDSFYKLKTSYNIEPITFLHKI